MSATEIQTLNMPSSSPSTPLWHSIKLLYFSLKYQPGKGAKFGFLKFLRSHRFLIYLGDTNKLQSLEISPLLSQCKTDWNQILPSHGFIYCYFKVKSNY